MLKVENKPLHSRWWTTCRLFLNWSKIFTCFESANQCCSPQVNPGWYTQNCRSKGGTLECVEEFFERDDQFACFCSSFAPQRGSPNLGKGVLRKRRHDFGFKILNDNGHVDFIFFFFFCQGKGRRTETCLQNFRYDSKNVYVYLHFHCDFQPFSLLKRKKRKETVDDAFVFTCWIK